MTASKPSARTRSGVAIRLALVALLGFSMADTALAVGNPLISGAQQGSRDLTPFFKWTSVIPRYEEQLQNSREECIGEGCLNQQWESLIEDLKGKPVNEQIEAVNNFFNAITYVTDEDNFGVADKWQTPYEMFKYGGDCEDYAIGKYITLKRLGVSESDMKIAIVRDRSLGGIIHAILEVNYEGKVAVLDNQEKRVKSLASIVRYQPVYAINEQQWWAYRQ